MKFGQQLSSRRARYLLTQEDLAAKAEIPLPQYRRYESGKAFPSLEELIRLADVLACSTDWLLGRVNSEGYWLKTLQPLKPMWVNQPSSLQPFHKYNGREVWALVAGEHTCVCFIDGDEAGTCCEAWPEWLSDGWPKSRPELHRHNS